MLGKDKKNAERNLDLRKANRWDLAVDILGESDAINEKYDSEIESMKALMEEDESQKTSWVPFGNWRPTVISTTITIFTSVLTGLIVYYLTTK